jgi:hypothetical protein
MFSPKSTQALLDFPPYYPSDLIPLTTVVIGQAIRKFPAQTQTLDLCKYVVSELTPHLCTAVRGGILSSSSVALSRMSELLHYLLVANCEHESERFQLKQEIARADEWTKLAGEVRKTSAPTSQRAHGGQTQSEEGIWGKIDRDFVKLIVDRLEDELDQKYASLQDQIYPNVTRPEPAYRFPLEVAKLCVERTKESINRYFQIYCEVWEQHQEKARTASFVRAIFARALLPSLDKGIANVKQTLSHPAFRSHAEDEVALWADDVIQDASRLKQEWQNRIEIEAKGLEWKQRNSRRPRLNGKRVKQLAARKSQSRPRKKSGGRAKPAAKGFEHSDDYRWVRLAEQEFFLTSRQAQIIQRLHHAYISGRPELSTDSVMAEIGTISSRLRDSFRSQPGALKALVARPRRGFVRLNL